MKSTRDIYWVRGVSRSKLTALGAEHIVENIDDNDMTQCELTQDGAKALIPRKTLYCYEMVDGKLKCCPFWDRIEQFPKQSNGYCHYLKQGDFQLNSTSLLWDQCKECSIGWDIDFIVD